jgi:oligoribonuclease NrnB/cAMP/cGMP phosphodiesterase (DHH superfamily)
MNPTLCIYHRNCADGFAAAWAVREALPDCEFYGATHGDAPPDVAGRDVVMVDFSYKRPVLEAMASAANSILILDHHKSAAEDLAELPRPPENWAEWEEQIRQSRPVPAADASDLEWTRYAATVAVLFDMERSGAGLAWDFFHDAPRPPLIDHVEDRDLWRFALPGTREIQANLFSHPYDFSLWDVLMGNSRIPQWLESFRLGGEAIERKHHKDVAELVDATLRYMVIGGHRVPVANVPYTLTSDAGHLMAEGNPFAACYWDTPDGRVFSLRSHRDGADVSAIATQYGGGGHRNAAGFRMPIGWEGDAE